MDVEGIDPVAVYAALMSTLVRTVFAQPDAASAWAQHARVVDQPAERFPAAAELVADAAADLLAFTAFPAETGARPGPTIPEAAEQRARRACLPTEVCSCSRITSGLSQDQHSTTARHARNRLIKLPFGFGICPFHQAVVHYRYRVELSNS
jgi:transposase-like protein